MMYFRVSNLLIKGSILLEILKYKKVYILYYSIDVVSNHLVTFMVCMLKV